MRKRTTIWARIRMRIKKKIKMRIRITKPVLNFFTGILDTDKIPVSNFGYSVEIQKLWILGDYKNKYCASSKTNMDVTWTLKTLANLGYVSSS